MSSLSVFLVIVAARAMLSTAVIIPRPKRTLSCLLVFVLICTPHNRNWGIKAVAMSHTHARAIWVQQQRTVLIGWRQVSLTRIDLISYDQNVLGKAFRVWDCIPIGLEGNARNAKCDAGIRSHKEVYKKRYIDHSLLPFLVAWKQPQDEQHHWSPDEEVGDVDLNVTNVLPTNSLEACRVGELDMNHTTFLLPRTRPEWGRFHVVPSHWGKL